MFITVIKIIGIILLICLIIVLLLVGYLLFAPFRYSLNADFDEKKYQLKVSEFLSLFSFNVTYNDNLKIFLGIFFGAIKINLGGEKKDKKKEKDKKNKNDEGKKSGKKDKKEEDKSKRQNPIKSLAESANRAGLKHIIKCTFKFLSKLLPKKIIAKIDFGFDTPDITGYLCGFLSALPFIYRDSVNIHPDFLCDKGYIQGKLRITGGIRLISAVVLFFNIFKNKNARGLILRKN